MCIIKPPSYNFSMFTCTETNLAVRSVCEAYLFQEKDACFKWVYIMEFTFAKNKTFSSSIAFLYCLQRVNGYFMVEHYKRYSVPKIFNKTIFERCEKSDHIGSTLIFILEPCTNVSSSRNYRCAYFNSQYPPIPIRC